MLLVCVLGAFVVCMGAVCFWDAVAQTSHREALVSRLTRRRERRLAAEAAAWLAGRDRS